MKAGAATLTLDCDMGAFLRSMSRAAESVTRYRLRKVSLGRDRRMREVEFEESWGKFIPSSVFLAMSWIGEQILEWMRRLNAERD